MIPAAVAWGLVAFVGLVAELSWVGVATATLVIIGLLLWLFARRSRRRGRVGLAAVTLLVCGLCLIATIGHRMLVTAGQVDELAAHQAVAVVTGQVAADPRPVINEAHPAGAIITAGGSEREDGRAASHTEPRDTGRWVVRLEVREVTARGVTSAAASRVLVVGGAEYASLRWHDEIRVSVRLAPAEAGDDVVAIGTPLGGPTITARAGGIFALAESVRADFRLAADGLPADARGLVPALVVGDTSLTPADLTQAMLATGMSHLSAVSGSNVTIVLGVGFLLCRRLRLPRRWRTVVAAGVLAGFVILARPEPSVIRAAVMGGVGLIGLTTARRQMGLPALAAAIVGLLLWDPWLARSYGFALSSVATLGLLVFAHPWGQVIGAWLPARLRFLGPIIAVPVAAQAVCAPIVVPLQGSVSFIAVFANLMAAPLVAPATIAGVTVAVLAPVWGAAASLLAWTAALPALGIAWVARYCASVPFGAVDWNDSAASAVWLAVLTLLVIAVLPFVSNRFRRYPLIAAGLVLVTSAFATPTRTIGWPPPGWLLVACDVGQGDGLVVATGPGRAMVVDVGPDPRVMDGCLDRLGVSTIDLLVITHLHADHVNGVQAAVDGRSVGRLIVTRVLDPPDAAAALERFARQHGIAWQAVGAGDRVSVGPVHAEVWWPARAIHAGSVPNNGSLVLTAEVNGIRLLLLGDVEREAVAEVIRRARDDPATWGRIDVIKVAHHGSSNRDDRLLDLVSGPFAVVSVGRDNDYGHPAPSTMRALADRGFTIGRTDRDGDLALALRDGEPILVRRGP